MGMLSKWIDTRKSHMADKAYKDGFKWAMCAYHIEDMSLCYIDDLATGGHPFDRGARKALQVIHENKGE